MRRTLAVLVLAAGLTLASACTAGTSAEEDIAPAGQQAKGTVTFWHFFKDQREQKAIAEVVADFQKANPGITVEIRGAQDDEKTRQAISAGKGPDVALSYSTDVVGSFCSSGAFRDLGPYLRRDKVDVGIFPDSVRAYTEFQGKRCAMPVLADVFGLYYNKTLLRQAGYTHPPRTVAELAEMSKKITKKAPDGTIQVAGFVPFTDFYSNMPAHWAPFWGAKWLTEDGRSAVGTDPAWKALARWQKDLVDFYGAENLKKFIAGVGQYIAPDNAFNTGKLAFMVDGEYRMAFLEDQAPDVDYGVAPFPVWDQRQDLYGAGYVTGNIIGIPTGAKNPEAAWALVKYLSTDTGAVVKLANAIRNIPTTKPALASPRLDKDEKWQVFLDIFAHPKTSTTPATRNGAQYADMTKDFLVKWQTGQVPDLDAGLRQLDQQINGALELGGAP